MCRLLLAATLGLYSVTCVIGITWGLPSRAADRYLFGDGEAWSGARMLELVGGGAWSDAGRGADVDADPIHREEGLVDLTATDRDVAAIYIRYRLYTAQPDEMITMRSLGSMRPSQGRLDPRLYQYGGLFIYPVGVLIKLCGVVGLIDVRSDVAYYLDRPDEFARFYIVARAYAAAWGAVGLLVVYAIGRRLGGRWSGLLAAVLFAVMPVVACMSHEGKPHLPGAVLMLTAVLAAMRYLQYARTRDWVFLGLACGAAFGTVLSSLPVFCLIPLAEGMRWQRERVSRPRPPAARALARCAGGGLIGAAAYLATNPYILINAFVNRSVLASNFGNSLAMYEVARVGQGLLRVLELTAEGASMAVLVVGTASLVAALRYRRWDALPLIVPAAVILLQFVLLGAGKPAEYGRFGVFPDAGLAIASACGLSAMVGVFRRRQMRTAATASLVVVALVIGAAASGGVAYLWNFHADTAIENANTRGRVARVIAGGMAGEKGDPIGVIAEPAPYCCPPMNFAETRVLLADRPDQSDRSAGLLLIAAHDGRTIFGPALDVDQARRMSISVDGRCHTPISWANKPFLVFLPMPGPKP